MHTLHTNPRILHIYLPWLASALAAALELEGAHRLRRAMWGVHPIRPGWGGCCFACSGWQVRSR
jgi:hypothetical protein